MKKGESKLSFLIHLSYQLLISYFIISHYRHTVNGIKIPISSPDAIYNINLNHLNRGEVFCNINVKRIPNTQAIIRAIVPIIDFFINLYCFSYFKLNVSLSV